jgi:hypothetical protein
MPEPGPVGVNVDPLGEPLGASVFPDGFVLVLGPVLRLIPVVEPGGLPIAFPLTDEPVVVPVVAEPPVVELPPDIPPLLLCASANVLESASAPANANVASFMVVSLVDDGEETRKSDGCSAVLQHEDVSKFRRDRKIRTWEALHTPEQQPTEAGRSSVAFCRKAVGA